MAKNELNLQLNCSHTHTLMDDLIEVIKKDDLDTFSKGDQRRKKKKTSPLLFRD